MVKKIKRFSFHLYYFSLTLFIFGCTSLNQAIIKGDLKQANKMIIQGKEINSFDEYNRTPLMHASMKGHLDMVRLLVGKGANIDAKDMYDETALMKASKFGHSNIAKLLITKGASIGFKGMHGQNSLIYALKRDDDSLVEFLLSKGSDVNSVEEDTSISSYIEQENYSEADSSVRISGRVYRLPDSDNRSPIMIALEMGRLNSISLLLDRGADILFVSELGKTTLMSASIGGNSDLVTRLVAEGIDINAKTKNKGETALMFAASVGHLDVVKKLVTEGAAINIKNVLGYSAVDFGSHKDKQDVVNYLYKSGAKFTNPIESDYYYSGHENNGHELSKAAKVYRAYAGYLETGSDVNGVIAFYEKGATYFEKAQKIFKKEHLDWVKRKRTTQLLNAASFVVANVGAGAMAKANAKTSGTGTGVGVTQYSTSSTSLHDRMAAMFQEFAEASRTEIVAIRRIVDCYKTNFDKNTIKKCRGEVIKFGEQS